MKVGKYFLTVSLVFCFGVSMMVVGCDSTGATAMQDKQPLIETQQVACDTVEVSRSVQQFPVAAQAGKAVTLEKIAPKKVKANSPFEYNFKVTNLTNSTITNVVVADKIGNDMVFIESSKTMERLGEEMVRWKVGMLKPAESAMIYSKAMVSGSAPITSCAEVFYECPVCAKIEIINADLKFSMAAPKQVMACDRIELKYQVMNHGTASACDIVIKEKLPEGLLTAEGKDSFEFKIDTLRPRENCEFIKMVDPIKSGKFISKATLSSETIETLESNVVEINVVEPVLKLTENDTENNTLQIGKIFEYVISNDGKAVASNAMIMAMLPEGAVLTEVSDNGKISESDHRVIAWNLGDLKPNTSKKVSMVIDSENEIMTNPQAVAKANCAHTVAAIRLPEFNELMSVSLYKPLVPE